MNFESVDILPMNAVPFDMPTDAVQQDLLQSAYPDIYYDLYPQIMDAVNRITTGGYSPSQENLDSVVDTIIKNSGMWYEDDDNDDMPDEMPVVRGMPYRRRRRRHHNRNTLRDITRILLLRELLDRGHRRPHGY